MLSRSSKAASAGHRCCLPLTRTAQVQVNTISVRAGVHALNTSRQARSLGWQRCVMRCCLIIHRGHRRQVDRSKENLFFPTSQSLAYLDGSLPADFGFDPLGLLDPESKGVGFINPQWLRYACALS